MLVIDSSEFRELARDARALIAIHGHADPLQDPDRGQPLGPDLKQTVAFSAIFWLNVVEAQLPVGEPPVTCSWESCRSLASEVEPPLSMADLGYLLGRVLEAVADQRSREPDPQLGLVHLATQMAILWRIELVLPAARRLISAVSGAEENDLAALRQNEQVASWLEAASPFDLGPESLAILHLSRDEINDELTAAPTPSGHDQPAALIQLQRFAMLCHMGAVG